MWQVVAKFNPLGGLNSEKYVGLTKDQAKAIHNMFYNEGWGEVRSTLMEHA